MKIKAFLILGITSVAIGQAYLWANDTSFTEEKDKFVTQMTDYLSIKKEETLNNVSNYVEEKKNHAIDSTKQTIKEGFNKALGSVGIFNTPETENSNKEKNSEVKGEAISEKNDNIEKISKKEISWKYQVNFKYDHQGSPYNLSEKKMLSLIKDASNIWEKYCGVKFNMIGNIQSDYISVEDNKNTKNDFGIIRWSDLSSDIMGQAHLGGINGPANGFILDIDKNFFQNYEGSSHEVKTLKALLVHELGHVIGLEHSRVEESIMFFKGGDQSPDLNKGDIEMCRNIASQWEKRPTNKKFKI